MRFRAFLILLLFSATMWAQVNIQNGFAAAGYDVVAYFDGEAKKGSTDFKTEFENSTYLFSSEEHLKMFSNNPSKFVPQYGGYCAYAIAVSNDKVRINPKTFKVDNDKLYLFYNKWGTNTLKKWDDENPKELKKQADANWQDMMKKKS